MNGPEAKLFSLDSVALLWVLLLSCQAVVAQEGFERISFEEPEGRAALKKLIPEGRRFSSNPIFKYDCELFGYPLEHFVTLFENSDHVVDPALRFNCRDGYKAIVVLSEVSDLNRGFLVSKQLSHSKGGCPWSPINEGKVSVDPSPFALLWSDGPEKESGLPLPFGIVSVELASAKDLYGASYPLAHPEVLPGFRVFQKKCISCHSVNMEGGAVGPELNVPKNVTEYWQKEHFFGFVKSPQSYRWKSRMAIGHLSDDELRDVHRYLVSMKDNKVCLSPADCEVWEAKRFDVSSKKQSNGR